MLDTTWNKPLSAVRERIEKREGVMGF